MVSKCYLDCSRHYASARGNHIDQPHYVSHNRSQGLNAPPSINGCKGQITACGQRPERHEGAVTQPSAESWQSQLQHHLSSEG